jgi:hypothetical protein
VKKAEAIMEILAAYDLTNSYRDAAALVGCAPNTVAHYVAAREAGGLRATPIQRSQLIDPFREKLEEWVEASRGRVRADVAQRKLEAMGYAGSERTTRWCPGKWGLSDRRFSPASSLGCVLQQRWLWQPVG